MKFFTYFFPQREAALDSAKKFFLPMYGELKNLLGGSKNEGGD